MKTYISLPITGHDIEQVEAAIIFTSAVQETTERVAVRDLYGALTAEERQKAAHACTKIMLCADILNAAAVDLQGIIHRAEPGADLLLY